MLDQLDQMQVTTPVLPLPSSSPCSYAIGSIDPVQFITLQVHLTTGEECSLLVPIHLSPYFFIDPLFKEGYECGYLDGDAETERTLALVGLAHLCFLQPFLTLDADTPFRPQCSLRRADFPHRQALCAYRKQVRNYREQGISFAEAQRLALVA